MIFLTLFCVMSIIYINCITYDFITHLFSYMPHLYIKDTTYIYIMSVVAYTWNIYIYYGIIIMTIIKRLLYTTAQLVITRITVNENIGSNKNMTVVLTLRIDYQKKSSVFFFYFKNKKA